MKVIESRNIRTAAINVKKGIVYINPSFALLPYNTRLFLLCHEFAHYHLQSGNEILVDNFAHQLYTRLGGSPKDSVFALTKVLPFEGKNKNEQIQRVKNQFNRAKIYNIFMNNGQFNADLAVLQISQQYAQGDEEGAFAMYEAVRNMLSDEQISDLDDLFDDSETENFEGFDWRKMSKEQLATLCIAAKRLGNEGAAGMIRSELRKRIRGRKRNFEGDTEFYAEGAKVKKGLFGGLKATVKQIKDNKQAKATAKAEQKSEKNAAKVEIKKAKAEAIKVKAAAKMTLAEQGIGGQKVNAQQILGGLGGVAKSVAGFATGNIAAGAEGIAEAAERMSAKGTEGEQLTTVQPGTENAAQQPKDAPTEPKKVPVWAWITGGSVLLIIIAIVLYFALRKKD